MKYVKFTGKFRDLIPDGWKFCKLFARNYRQYSKTVDGEEYGQKCRIWQHLGSYLEIDDLCYLSYIIVEKVKNGTIEGCGHESPNIFDRTKLEKHYWFKIDTDAGLLHPYTSQTYKDIQKEEWDLPNIKDKKKLKEAANIFYNRYRSWNMRPELITMIKDLIDKGWIDVVDVPEGDKCPYTK